MTTLIIVAKVDEKTEWETITRTVRADEPSCCGQPMEYIGTSKSGVEIWHCNDCHTTEDFYGGYYGEDEVTITREEWEAEQAIERQRDYLKRRYGKDWGKSIRDYWQRTAASQRDGGEGGNDST